MALLLKKCVTCPLGSVRGEFSKYKDVPKDLPHSFSKSFHLTFLTWHMLTLILAVSHFFLLLYVRSLPVKRIHLSTSHYKAPCENFKGELAGNMGFPWSLCTFSLCIKGELCNWSDFQFHLGFQEDQNRIRKSLSRQFQRRPDLVMFYSIISLDLQFLFQLVILPGLRICLTHTTAHGFHVVYLPQISCGMQLDWTCLLSEFCFASYACNILFKKS